MGRHLADRPTPALRRYATAVAAADRIVKRRWLATLFAPHRYRLAGDAPVVGGYFLDDDDGGVRVLAEHTHQQVGGAADELGLLLSGGAFLGEFDVDVGHGSSEL